MNTGVVGLRLPGRVVAEYVIDPDLDPKHGPRPYLHPVRTLGGVTVTDALPADHVWHLGASLAVQDVAGTNLWGGRTYVRDAGYTWRADHGRMVHDSWITRDADRLAHRLRWCDRDGGVLLDERRSLAARIVLPATDPAPAAVAGADAAGAAPTAEPASAVDRVTAVEIASTAGTALTPDPASAVDMATAVGIASTAGTALAPGAIAAVDPAFAAGAVPAVNPAGATSAAPGATSASSGATSAGVWALDVAYTLTAPVGRDIVLGSPATNGRPGGAGYGGFFWRVAPDDRPPAVFSERCTGEEEVNGSAEPWVALARPAYTLVFHGLGNGDRWFVRARMYPGVCAAFAFEKPRMIAAGTNLTGHHTVLVADGELDRPGVRTLLTRAGLPG